MTADTLAGIRVFCRVVELKSFAEAARQLEMSPAMATKYVAQLEQRLGTRLLNRSSRHLSLTESGTEYHTKALPLIAELDEVESSISEAAKSPGGTLRITAPVWFANPEFTGILDRYQQRYPRVRLDVDLSGRAVNLVEDGFDLALRVARFPGDNWIARPLGTVRFRFVAAPNYLEKSGTPRTLVELATHSLLFYPLAPTLLEISEDGPNGHEHVSLRSNFQSANESLLYLATLQGMGFALLPDQLISKDVEAGRLVVLLPDYPERRAPILGIYPNRKYLSSKVRTFLDFVVATMEPTAVAQRPPP
jgi:DNA-binding transcriptional LysR family regulator